MADQDKEKTVGEEQVNTRELQGTVISNGETEFEERVVHINRSSKVVKGGKNFPSAPSLLLAT